MPSKSAPVFSSVAELYVGMVVQYRPPVSGGMVIGVVTKLTSRNELSLRVTDGNAVYPTGSFVATSIGWVS